MCVVQQRKVLNAIETMKSKIIGLNPVHVQGKLASSVYVISASPVAWQRRAFGARHFSLFWRYLLPDYFERPSKSCLTLRTDSIGRRRNCQLAHLLCTEKPKLVLSEKLAAPRRRRISRDLPRQVRSCHTSHCKLNIVPCEHA